MSKICFHSPKNSAVYLFCTVLKFTLIDSVSFIQNFLLIIVYFSFLLLYVIMLCVVMLCVKPFVPVVFKPVWHMTYHRLVICFANELFSSTCHTWTFLFN